MNSLQRSGKLASLLINLRNARTASNSNTYSPALKNFNPERYDVSLRTPTMDDLMEPYGSYKVAYEHERKYANKVFLKGLLTFSVSCAIFYYSGTMDSLFMPNLDNIMAETEPFNFDTEGRILSPPID